MEGGTMIYVKRTFHPIGQGAFFTREHRDRCAFHG